MDDDDDIFVRAMVRMDSFRRGRRRRREVQVAFFFDSHANKHQGRSRSRDLVLLIPTWNFQGKGLTIPLPKENAMKRP